MPVSAVSELEGLVQGMVKRGEKLDTGHLKKVAETVSRIFSVKTDEVAILSLTPDRRFLFFHVPEELKSVGQIPLTSATALAARTLREKRPEVINRFNIVPHASVFESVPLKEERGEPIQKIMSVPILKGHDAIGVLQISRKARNPADVTEFSPLDLKQLVSVAAFVAPALALCTE
ncbi:MAG TPA: GAF domain-containing protein [Candidatus Acidoferrales bacterium]|nr:GAF domain-containing protein [Candidatus Acidoferrales bacterium]